MGRLTGVTKVIITAVLLLVDMLCVLFSKLSLSPLSLLLKELDEILSMLIDRYLIPSCKGSSDVRNTLESRMGVRAYLLNVGFSKLRGTVLAFSEG